MNKRKGFIIIVAIITFLWAATYTGVFTAGDGLEYEYKFALIVSNQAPVIKVGMIYQALLLLIILVMGWLDKKIQKTNIKQVISVIIFMVFIFVAEAIPFIFDETFYETFGGYLDITWFYLINWTIFILLCGYVLHALNKKDYENIGKFYPLIVVIDAILYPFILIYEIFYKPIYYFVVQRIKKEKSPKNDAKLYLQIFLGVLCALPIVMITTLLLGFADFGFIKMIFDVNFNVMPIIQTVVITYIVYSFYYIEGKDEYNKSIVSLMKVKRDTSKLKVFPNVILLALLPGYLLFVMYEIAKFINPDNLYGVSVVEGYNFICIVVIINIIIVLLSYYLYKSKDIISKIIRVIVLGISIFLLIIAAMQINVYINNFSSLTLKRFDGIVGISILMFILIALIVKTIRKKTVLNVFLFFLLIYTYSMVYIVDNDGIVYRYNENHKVGNENFDAQYMQELNPKWIENEYVGEQ